jgi:phosphatidylglycerol:prolipoprotein diacylglycerol transferase
MHDLAVYVHDLDPFLIRFSENWGIRWYGIAYLAGFLAVFFGFRWFRKKGWSEVPEERVGDLLTWAIIGTLVGGRLGYCLLYDFQATITDPLRVIAFWRGGISGMASHGGFVGVVLAVGWFARKNGFQILPIFDHLSIWATPGIFFGRIANFINGELWGRPTEVSWGVIFPDAPSIAGRLVARHPSQLYEAFGEGLLLFVVLFWLRLRNPVPGVIAGVFLVGYGIIRIIGECFREPDAHIGFLFGGVTQGQMLSFFLIGAGAVILSGRKRCS